MVDISIIIPCYNEVNNIAKIAYQIDKIKKENTDLVLSFIIVNNGSADNTKSELDKYSGNNNFKVVNLDKNQGYGGGILKGLEQAEGQIISWTHGDLQCDLNDVIKAYRSNKSKLLSNNCIVKGKRIKRKFFDAFFSTSMAIIASILFLKKFNEINAQPKIFSHKIAKKLKYSPTDFSLDLYLLYISKKNKYEIIEYPVIYKKRQSGISKGGDSIKGKIKLSIRSLKYMFKLRFNTNEINHS